MPTWLVAGEVDARVMTPPCWPFRRPMTALVGLHLIGDVASARSSCAPRSSESAAPPHPARPFVDRFATTTPEKVPGTFFLEHEPMWAKHQRVVLARSARRATDTTASRSASMSCANPMSRTCDRQQPTQGRRGFFGQRLGRARIQAIGHDVDGHDVDAPATRASRRRDSATPRRCTSRARRAAACRGPAAVRARRESPSMQIDAGRHTLDRSHLGARDLRVLAW